MHSPQATCWGDEALNTAGSAANTDEIRTEKIGGIGQSSNDLKGKGTERELILTGPFHVQT
jgi:hypothetical protein